MVTGTTSELNTKDSVLPKFQNDRSLFKIWMESPAGKAVIVYIAAFVLIAIQF